jgi:uncharacterized membrane protein
MNLLPAIVIPAALGCGLVAGIFYGFSSFIMRGLARLPAQDGVAAMNAINVTVLTPSFLWLFSGTALVCVGLALWSLVSIGRLESQLILAASLAYVIGCFGVTMALNVPLNNQLAAVAADAAPALWAHYLKAWTLWNTVRTAASALALGLFCLVLLRH